MAEKNDVMPPVDVSKQKLLWKMVNEPDYAEKNKHKIQAEIYNKKQKDGVPLIPQDLLRGSTEVTSDNKLIKKLSVNPLVPIGMAATVGCLIGKFTTI